MFPLKNKQQKSYPDICIERADKASPGPWKLKITIEDIGFLQQVLTQTYSVDGVHPTVSFIGKGGPAELDAKFIAHARTDVVELATRLKRACAKLKQLNELNAEYDEEFEDNIAFIDELEAQPEEKAR